MYNTLKGSLARLEEDACAILEKGGSGGPDELVDALVSHGMLVESDVDEPGLYMRRRTVGSRLPERAERVTLTIAPTTLCNCSCVYCFQGGCPRSGPMDAGTQAAVVSYARGQIEWFPNARELAVVWFGGEPTTEMGVVERLSASLASVAAEAGLGYRAKIITNGSLLCDEMLARIKACGIGSIQVTLDGDCDHHCRYKGVGPGQWRRTVDAIKSATEWATVIVRLNVSSENAGTFDEVVSEISRGSVRPGNLRFYAEPITGYGPIDPAAGCTPCSPGEFRAFCRDEADLLDSMGLDSSRLRGLPKVRCSYCAGATPSGSVVGPDGEIYQCDLCIGIEGTSVGDVWGGKDARRCAPWVEPGLPYDRCGACPLLPACAGGCVGRRLLYGMGPDCDEVRSLIEAGVVALYRRASAARS